MIDLAIWLVRWTIAGAALSAVVIAVEYVLERSGRAAGLHLYRITLVAAFVAPMIALASPVLTFSTTPPSPAEAYRPSSRTIEAIAGERPGGGGAAPVAQDRNDGAQGGGEADIVAIVLIAIWAAGVAFAAMRRHRSASRLSRAFRGGAPYSTSFAECRLSPDTRTPLIFGVVRARMLAPEDFPEWSAAEREAVLRHEAAHVRRGDLVWASLGDAVSIIYWWMPPVTALTRRHILATEEACDSASLDGGDNRHEYARTLLAISRRVGQHVTPGLAATGPSLRRRVERLIAPQQNFAFAAPVATLAAAASIALALTGPAAAHVGHFRIYIYIAAGGVTDTYVWTDGARATAATVRNCVGQRTPNASSIVAQLDERIDNGQQNQLDPVTIVGPGSEIELGSCEPSSTRDVADQDTLVVVVDASERQARGLIRQIHGLPREEQREMLAELGLSNRR
jgi:beta-lactamase regulating signal transducer with metallopeptidase domain